MHRLLSASLSLVVLFPVVLTFTACGSKEHEHKDFHVYVESNNSELKNKTLTLINEYNAAIGFTALHVDSVKGEDSSLIHFTQGLNSSTGKIGFGQSQVLTQDEPGYRRAEMRRINRDIAFSMDVELDMDYFSSRVNADPSTKAGREIHTLFAHEVGHGFTLDHDPNVKSVMYKIVLGEEDVDFPTYYQEVRNFFQSNQ